MNNTSTNDNAHTLMMLMRRILPTIILMPMPTQTQINTNAKTTNNPQNATRTNKPNNPNTNNSNPNDK